MGDRKKKWVFVTSDKRKPLDRSEVIYWKGQLAKIIKVGQEFEFNLPEPPNGRCKGDNDLCPCHQLAQEDCWKHCSGCDERDLDIRTTRTCENVTGTCEDEDCQRCKHFKFLCLGLECSGFISFCLSCTIFHRECKNCKNWFDPNKSPEAIRGELSNKFKPNNTYGIVSKTGVHKVTTDGSLLGGHGREKGVEIITIGRRIDYWEFYKMAKNIIDESVSRGAFVDERCSLHMHVLSSHYTGPNFNFEISEMEKDLPEIVLANFHQLCRKYQNAITWMTTGLDDPDQMTRWEKYRLSVLEFSAEEHMTHVREHIESRCYKPKYGWVNYNPTVFGPDGNVKRFHVEMRVADGILAPSAVAAVACMFYGLVIKAVELSRFGVLVPDNQWYVQAKKIKKCLLNNNRDWDNDRFSDTSMLHTYYKVLEEESLELVHQLKNILLKIGPAYDVLEKLAIEPCGIRRCKGKKWSDIEADLEVPVSEEDKLDIVLTEIITLLEIADCDNLDQWVEQAKEVVKIPEYENIEDSIKYYIKRKNEVGELVWSDKLGAPILV